MNVTVPAPLIGPLNAAAPLVGPPSCKVAPDATLHDPPQLPPQTPLSCSCSIPLLAITVPVLLNTIEPKTPPPLLFVPPVFSNVPALLNVGVPPPSNAMKVSFS